MAMSKLVQREAEAWLKEQAAKLPDAWPEPKTADDRAAHAVAIAVRNRDAAIIDALIALVRKEDE